MLAHQERVVTEKKELDEKLNKLELFIEGSATFEALKFNEQSRLRCQYNAMVEYSNILSQRIRAFDI